MSEGADFARVLTLADLGRRSAPLHLVADADERAGIAARFGLAALDRLEATLTVDVDGAEVTMTGTLDAAVEQTCVATGQPLAVTIDEPLSVRFVPLATLESTEDDAEIELDADQLDVIGYAGDRIDVGAMLADSLALALDPYPRSPDADTWLKAHHILSEEDVGAFSGLAALRDALGGAKPKD